MSPEGMGGLAGHSDLPPPPPGMTTHERLTQLLETEIQHGHLLQARPPTPPPARRVRAARLLSHRLPPPRRHRLPPPHPHRLHPRTRTPAHPRTFKPAASRWSAHSARSCAGWARCRVRDAALQAARGRRPLLASDRTQRRPCAPLAHVQHVLSTLNGRPAAPMLHGGSAMHVRTAYRAGRHPFRCMIHVCPVGATSASTTTYLVYRSRSLSA